MAGRTARDIGCRARSPLPGKRSLAYPRGETAVEYGDHGHSEPISGKDPPFAAGGKGYRAGMALPRMRSVAGRAAGPATDPRAGLGLSQAQAANHSGKQSTGDQISRIQQRFRSTAAAGKGRLRLHSGHGRRHDGRRHVRGAAARLFRRQGRQRLGEGSLQHAAARESAPVPALPDRKSTGRFGAVPQKARTDGDPLRKKAVANEKPKNLVSP